MKSRPLPPHSELKRLLTYDPATGLLTWKPRPDALACWTVRCAGKPALNVLHRTGYLVGTMPGRRKVAAHRVAYKLYHGVEADQVDHINGDKTDNRIVNLRSVNNSENQRNCPVKVTCKSGVPGVKYSRKLEKWVAGIVADGRWITLGHFGTRDEAICARKAAEPRYGYHANHGRPLMQGRA